MLRSSGRAVHRAARRTIPPRRPEPRLQVLEGAVAAGAARAPLGAAGGRRERVPRAGLRRRAGRSLVRRTSPTRRACSTSRSSRRRSTACRTARSCAAPRPAPARTPTTRARVAEALVQTLANFGVDATVIGQIAGPRVTRYELQLAPGTKVSKVAGLKDDLSYALATTEIRILAPIPGKQAVGVELPEHEPEPRHARRHLRRPAGDLEPALGLARQGHLRPGRLDRPRAHAAHPDRRHDRLGQVRLHQHDPHLDAAALDARRRADDPDRPEADRAQLLRVDPAPAHAGRLEPEGGRGGAAQRRRRDGAPLRAPLGRARPQPRRGEPRLPLARRADAARTCSS